LVDAVIEIAALMIEN